MDRATWTFLTTAAVIILAAVFIVMSAVRDRNLIVKNSRKPVYCINGFQYFSYYKGASLYLTPEGKPLECNTKEQ